LCSACSRRAASSATRCDRSKNGNESAPPQRTHAPRSSTHAVPAAMIAPGVLAKNPLGSDSDSDSDMITVPTRTTSNCGDRRDRRCIVSSRRSCP
jgi:hypothetical protein